MSRFIKLDQLDPYRLFGSSLRRAQHGMKTAFDAAFAAYDRCNDLLKEHDWGRTQIDDSTNVWSTLGLTPNTSFSRGPLPSMTNLERVYTESMAEDLQADYQASIVLLFADDALQRFAKGVLGKAPGIGPGYGPDYGTHRGTVPLTDLLRASTNALRHVSEWDDYPWAVSTPGAVYPTLAQCKNNCERGMIASITIIQNVHGLGISERIRDVVSMRTLIRVDGTGTDTAEYSRFEDAVIAAAREIATKKGGTAPAQLDAEI